MDDNKQYQDRFKNETELLKQKANATAPDAGEARPPVIDAATFVKERYDLKIAAGECEVSNSLGGIVLSVERWHDAYSVCSRPPMSNLIGKNSYIATDDVHFTVTWLIPQQPAPATVQPVGGEGDSVGKVVIAQRDFKVPNEEPIILGTFGIVLEDYGKSLLVHFAGCRMAVDVNSAYVVEMGNDNWNDHILRQQAQIATLRTALAASEHAKKALAESNQVLCNWIFDTLSTASGVTNDLKKAELLAMWKSLGKQAGVALNAANEHTESGGTVAESSTGMNEQQRKTLSVRVHVARDIATERLLTALAKEPLFANAPSNEIIATIVGLNSFDEDTQADMLAYLESERAK